MKFYSSEAFHILVLTSPEFEESVHQMSKTLDLKINIMCLNIGTIFDAACARLRIFDYPRITEYKNLLYLDTDIIIKGDLAPLFQVELEERLYGIEQGSIDAPNFGKMFFNAQTDFRITGLNSGTLLFKNCLVMRDLFSRIRGHIAAFTDSSQPIPYALDQPFINYHAIKDGLYNNKALNPYVSLYENADTVANYATSVICHFSFPIGNFEHKYYRMKQFFIGLLSINSTRIPSPMNIIKTIFEKPFEEVCTLLSKSRLFNVFNQCVKFQDTGYSFIECGVAKGGALALMKYASTNNPVFGFDSFEGMPDIVEKDLGDYNKSDPLHGFGKVGDNLSGGIESVYTTFKSLNQSMENVYLIKGFFNDTLALNKDKCEKIAVLRIDADWYESCKICLEELYDQVVDGGVIISDDYGHYIGAKRAIDEFRESRGITSPLIQTDYTEFYWIKGASEINQLVCKSYNWGSGYIKFYKDHLETTWGRGIYKFKDTYTVVASWNGYDHILQFNHNYSSAVSIRTLPDDCNIGYHSIYDPINPLNVFTKIYESGTWGDNGNSEYKGSSGDGSFIEYNKVYIELVKLFIKDNNIQSVTDLGCGDWKCGKLIYDELSINYNGYDAYAKLIEYNQKTYGSSKYSFTFLDFLNSPEKIKSSDLCIIKDVLQHWPLNSIYSFLDTIYNSKKFKYILITNCSYQNTDNTDILMGQFRPLSKNFLPLKKYNPQLLLTYKSKEVLLLEKTPDIDISIQKIPKIFFQTSKVPMQAYVIEMIKCMLSEDWVYKHFLDEDIIDFLKSHQVEEFPGALQIFQNLKRGEHKADFFRYYFLYCKGGVFMDSDAMIYKPIDQIIKDYKFFSVNSEVIPGAIFQGILGAEPGNPLIRKALQFFFKGDFKALDLDYHHLCRDLFHIYQENPEKEGYHLFRESPDNQGDRILEGQELLFRHYWRNEVIPIKST